MASLDLSRVCKSFGATPVLRDVSLAIRDGEFLTLVGPSGCGKTTLLRIVAGLGHAERGSVAIAGRAVDDLPPKKRDVAMVFQSYALYPYMTVRENMALPLLMRRSSRWQRLPFVGRHLPGSAALMREIDARVASTCARSGSRCAIRQRAHSPAKAWCTARSQIAHPQLALGGLRAHRLHAEVIDRRPEVRQLLERPGGHHGGEVGRDIRGRPRREISAAPAAPRSTLLRLLIGSPWPWLATAVPGIR